VAQCGAVQQTSFFKNRNQIHNHHTNTKDFARSFFLAGGLIKADLFVRAVFSIFFLFLRGK
jgi:hypothetical protein